MNTVNSKKTHKIFHNVLQFCIKENRHQHLCYDDAGAGAHGEGFTAPNILRSDFVNLFVYTHTSY